MRYHLGAFALLLLSVTPPSLAQDRNPLEALSADLQAEIGLSKLTDEERAALFVLLEQVYQAGVESGRKAAPASTSPGRSATQSVIESKVDGDFEGWEGETIVKLMNGQVWQQTEYYYHYHYA